MAENTEIEDQVDLDDDNYTEEEDDVEEPMEDEGAGEGGDENGEELQEDTTSDDGRKEHSFGNDLNDSSTKHVEDEENSVQDDEKAKHLELLALPPHGSEVFIGGLSRDVSENDLMELCEPFGEIFEIRVMKNRDTGESKGFAFVAFKTKDEAQKAIEKLCNKEFKGRTLRCSLSETKYRLFIGNVPKGLTDEEFRKIIEVTGPGAETIELIKDPQNPSRNRGFAFVEYYNNACADYSRQKMSAVSFKLDGNTPTVTWADPKITPDHSAAAAQVKALYVKNIPENTPTEQLKELFEWHGEVTKVVMPPAKSGGRRDFGFVNYAERSSALKAVKDTEKYEITEGAEFVMPPADSSNPIVPQEPLSGLVKRTKMSQVSDFLQHNCRIGTLRTSYEKHQRCVTLNLQEIFNSLVALYHSAIAAHWQYLKRYMDQYPSPGVTPQMYAARLYISAWIHDLYCSNRLAVKKLSLLAFSEYFDNDQAFYSYEYDSFLTSLNAAIRPTHIRGIAEDVLYIPVMHIAPQWGSDNPFTIINYANNYDALTGLIGILKHHKLWMFDSVVTNMLGRPSWLFDWHTDNRVCAWFPMEGNYTMDDISMAYILGAACTLKLGYRDVDEWQDFPGGIIPANINIATLQRLTPRCFYGGYEVRTYETNVPTAEASSGALATKKQKQSATMALPSMSAAVMGEPTGGSTIDIQMPDVQLPATFQLTDWTYYHLVILNTDDHTRSSALKMIIKP